MIELTRWERLKLWLFGCITISDERNNTPQDIKDRKVVVHAIIRVGKDDYQVLDESQEKAKMEFEELLRRENLRLRQVGPITYKDGTVVPEPTFAHIPYKYGRKDG